MHNLLLGRAPHKSVYSLFAPLQKPTKQIPIKQNSNTAWMIIQLSAVPKADKSIIIAVMCKSAYKDCRISLECA